MSSCSQCHCSVPGSSVDVYSTGITAEVWDLCIGNHKNRTSHYRDMLVKILEQNDCQNILDVACGTGVDSIMLLEEGFRMTSVDRSYQMLKHACKVRWERRKEQGFNDWGKKTPRFLFILLYKRDSYISS
ncbi:hypothetical protein SK128_010774 [Halocaridina rubra]|uniref:Glycine N-methyltransferase n=1 Tax=Halocaridina rubra TaxID=373956 RepID=A0AAN9AH64_HALRR